MTIAETIPCGPAYQRDKSPPDVVGTRQCGRCGSQSHRTASHQIVEANRQQASTGGIGI